MGMSAKTAAAVAAAAPTVMMVAGTAVSATGMIMQGRAAEAQAEGEQAMAEYNEKVSEQNAKATELKTTFEQWRQAKAGQRVLGTLRARLGGSGAMTEEGAPLSLVTEQAGELALENALIGYEGQVMAGQYRSQSALYGMEADIAGTRAGYAMPTAYMGAGGTLLTGFGTAKSMGMMGNSNQGWSNTARATALRY